MNVTNNTTEQSEKTAEEILEYLLAGKYIQYKDQMMKSRITDIIDSYYFHTNQNGNWTTEVITGCEAPTYTFTI